MVGQGGEELSALLANQGTKVLAGRKQLYAYERLY
jgi:hypothetical protein